MITVSIGIVKVSLGLCTLYPRISRKTDGAKNKELALEFSGGQKRLVTMAPNRKTPGDLSLSPPVETNKLKITIVAVYSQEYNGLSIVQLWKAARVGDPPISQVVVPHTSSNVRSVGIWGPWELCPPGQRVVNWQVKWSQSREIAGT